MRRGVGLPGVIVIFFYLQAQAGFCVICLLFRLIFSGRCFVCLAVCGQVPAEHRPEG